MYHFDAYIINHMGKLKGKNEKNTNEKFNTKSKRKWQLKNVFLKKINVWSFNFKNKNDQEKYKNKLL